MISRNSLSDTYPVRKLVEVVDFLDHLRRPVTESSRKAGPYPYYGANGLQGTIDNFVFDEPLVLLAEDGGHFDNPDRGIAYRISGRTWVNNHAHVLRPRSTTDLGYLCRVLENYDVTPFVTGTTRGKLTKAGASEIPIPLPPVAEQKRIAAILDQADVLRAKRREALAELDKLEDSLFEELQLKTRDSCEQVPLASLAANARGSFVNGPFGSDLLTGELQNEGVPVVYIRDIRDGKYLRVSKAFVSGKKADELNVCKVFPGDVLVAKVGDPPGISAVYPPNEPTAIVTQDVIRIRPNLDIVLPEFISAYINSSIGKWKISGITVEATRARFSLRDFKSLVVDLPPLSRQTTFVAQIKSLRQLSGSQGESMNDLNSLFASLQHRAFRGEL